MSASDESRDGYSVHPRTTANRHKKQVVYDYHTVHTAINTNSIVHVSFLPGNDDPFPATLPMIGVVANFKDQSASFSSGPFDVYIHGHVASRLAKLGTFSSASDEGLPVTISTATVQGLVLSLTPFSHSLNFMSAVVNGYASPVTDPEEKLFALSAITNKILAGRYEECRPPSQAEITSTTILRVRIVSASAKTRQGGPNDERKDVKDEELTAKVWTGVLPVWEVAGMPIPSSYNRVNEVPETIVAAIKNNKVNETFARDLAQKDIIK